MEDARIRKTIYYGLKKITKILDGINDSVCEAFIQQNSFIGRLFEKKFGKKTNGVEK